MSDTRLIEIVFDLRSEFRTQKDAGQSNLGAGQIAFSLRRRQRLEPRIYFKQSTFFSAPLSAKQLQKRAHSFMPNLSEEGRATAEALALMNGETSVQEIGARLAKDFPQRYERNGAVFNEAAELSSKYSQ
jgi:hypothetical protein